MASLEKLDVLGIRSFGNLFEEKQSISFEKPLTLIQGENGCGKSTIIECLRYITTMKEPSGKGSFIHDPNLTSTNTVKGQVKLLFKDTKGRDIHLSKSLQGVRARKTLQTRSLDSTITIDGKNFSSRCADINDEITRILGISKPILEHVIFCTQDDALWPLDTDLKVKERFDQIFDSDRHNRCLKKLREKRKALADDVKRCELSLKFLRENKTQAAVKRKDMKILEDQIKHHDDEVEDLVQKLTPIQEKLRSIEAVEKEMTDIYWSKKTTETKIQECDNAVKELKHKIQKAACEFRGSDNELEAALRECDVQTRNVVEAKKELDQLKVSEIELSRNITQTSGKIGELKQLIEMNSNRVREKENKMRKLADQLGMTSTHLSEDGLERRVDSKKNEVANLVKGHEEVEENLQKEVEKARENLSKQKFELKRLEDSLLEYSKEMNEIRGQLKNAEAYQERRLRVVEELNKADIELDQHKNQVNADEMTSNLQSLSSEVTLNEEQLSDVEKELKQLQIHSEIWSKCSRLKTENDSKTLEVRRLRNHWHDVLSDVLGTMPDSDYKGAVQSTMDKINRDLRDLNSRKTAKETELVRLKSNMQSLNDSILKKRAEYQKYQDEVNELTSGEDLDHTVDRIKNACQNLQDEKGALSSSQVIYERYIRTLSKSNPCCPLCKRDFAAEQEAAILVQTLKSNMRDIPTKMATVEMDLKNNEDLLPKLFAYQSKKEAMEYMNSSEIPNLIREQEEKKAAATRVRNDVDALQKDIQRSEKNKEACTSSLGDMALLDQNVEVIVKLKREIEQLERVLPKNWDGDMLAATESRRENLAQTRKAKQKQRDDLQVQLNVFNEKLAVLQNRKHKLAEEEFKLRSSSGQKKQQEERLSVLVTQTSTTQTKINEFRPSILPSESLCNTKISELRDKKEVHKKELRDANLKLNELNDQIRDIRRIQEDVDAFQRRGEEQKLDQLQNRLAQQEQDSRAIKIQIESINAKVGDLSKSEVRRRELEDNKGLRQKQAESKELMGKLDELNEKLTNIGFRPEEKQKLKAEEGKIGQRKAHLFGKKGAVEARLDALKKELKENYHDIDNRFKKEVIQKGVSDALATDLHRYISAMEYSIGKYHEEQMARVNSIIREYWRKIYKGNDIDYIEIATDQKDANMTENRRAYNYNLVQKKGDAMLEMRYRCSAGQKMLACLIVRMALAEVFSSTCGILALDEPTTNLDRKNIRNLAKALNELIEMKSGLPNTNFQLIVITHDKDFLEDLMLYNSIDRYVEVSRSREGKSLLRVKVIK